MGLRRLFAATMVALFLSTAAAQFSLPATDVEFGVNFDLDNNTDFPYLMARLNVPIGPEIAGVQTFALPELAAFFEDGVKMWARVQIVADSEYVSPFLDFQTSKALGARLRTGVRFSLF